MPTRHFYKFHLGRAGVEDPMPEGHGLVGRRPPSSRSVERRLIGRDKGSFWSIGTAAGFQ